MASDYITFISSYLQLVFLPLEQLWIMLTALISYAMELLGYKDRSLEGKVVLITGGSSGIGEGFAKVLYASGCKLILASRRIEELQRVKNDLVRSKTSGLVYVPAVHILDLSDLDSIPLAASSILEIYGYVDILVNNAGITHRGSVLDSTMEVHKNIMNVNYFGTLSLTKTIVTNMLDRNSGHVVFISSIQGKLALPFRSAYCSSKHAMQALADCLRAELSATPIKVTVVSPGYVATNLSLNALTATGEAHGIMDQATASGYSPEYIARETMKAVISGKKEIILSTYLHKIAIILRYLTPALIFYVMAKRAASGK